jgi:hypothetical protein
VVVAEFGGKLGNSGETLSLEMVQGPIG